MPAASKDEDQEKILNEAINKEIEGLEKFLTIVNNDEHAGDYLEILGEYSNYLNRSKNILGIFPEEVRNQIIVKIRNQLNNEVLKAFYVKIENEFNDDVKRAMNISPNTSEPIEKQLKRIINIQNGIKYFNMPGEKFLLGDAFRFKFEMTPEINKQIMSNADKLIDNAINEIEKANKDKTFFQKTFGIKPEKARIAERELYDLASKIIKNDNEQSGRVNAGSRRTKRENLPFFERMKEKIMTSEALEFEAVRYSKYFTLFEGPLPHSDKALNNLMKEVFPGRDSVSVGKGRSVTSKGVTFTRSGKGTEGTIKVEGNFTGVVKLARVDSRGNMLKGAHDYLVFKEGKLISEQCIFGQKGFSSFNRIKDKENPVKELEGIITNAKMVRNFDANKFANKVFDNMPDDFKKSNNVKTLFPQKLVSSTMFSDKVSEENIIDNKGYLKIDEMINKAPENHRNDFKTALTKTFQDPEFKSFNFDKHYIGENEKGEKNPRQARRNEGNSEYKNVAEEMKKALKSQSVKNNADILTSIAGQSPKIINRNNNSSGHGI